MTSGKSGRAKRRARSERRAEARQRARATLRKKEDQPGFLMRSVTSISKWAVEIFAKETVREVLSRVFAAVSESDTIELMRRLRTSALRNTQTYVCRS